MAGLTELAQVIHEEHFRSLVLICGLEGRVSGERAAHPIDPAVEEDRVLLEELIAGLDEISGHNAFEESVLFPLLKDKGEGELTQLLTCEHAALGPLAKRLRAVACAILADGSGAARWAEFCETARDLSAELMFHLQKEETVIVQKLGALLDPRIDHALALRFGKTAQASADEGEKAA